MAKKPKHDEVLRDLLAAASPDLLVDLLLRLSTSRPDVRRECFEYLKKHLPLSKQQQHSSEGETVLALWSELAPDLNELDEYGGGDHDVEDAVSSLLHQIEKRLSGKQVDADYRHRLLDLVLPYIASSNAGMDDALYAVAYAACYEDNDLRLLAEAFERMPGDRQKEHALRIYRKLGDRDKYLELRKRKMVYGADYYDLATFYWDAGEREKALKVAEEGLIKGQGRMDELHQFLARRALDSGNRERYLELQFAQATDHLTLEKYKIFKEICTSGEWEAFEAKVLDRLPKTWETEQLKIRMHRKDYKEALAVLIRGRYPIGDWGSDYKIQTAKELEDRFPEEILKYYLSGLGNLNINAVRKEYARKAKVMLRIRHVLIEILHDERRWLGFARQVKRDNLKRTALQEEFARMVPGWQDI